MTQDPPYPHLSKGPTCESVLVPVDACYLRFAPGPSLRSQMLAMETARGERLIVDYDASGKVIGIELIGPGKPCQEA